MINELFFKTHNLDILDLSLCKHSFNDDQGISIVNAATYLKMNIDLLRNAMDRQLLVIYKHL